MFFLVFLLKQQQQQIYWAMHSQQDILQPKGLPIIKKSSMTNTKGIPNERL